MFKKAATSSWRSSQTSQSHLFILITSLLQYTTASSSPHPSTMKLANFAACTLAFFLTNAFAYPITGDTVNCRSCPGTNFPVVKTYKKGQGVSITCQAAGTDISGTSIWDKTSDGCYVTDYYVYTGSDGYVKAKCTGSVTPPSSSKIPGPMTNDYPYQSDCGPVDQWNYFKCQCTSFVAWRINERLGIHFTNQYKGTNWGNADTWDDAARRTGVRVDNEPVAGCVAQSNAGSAGAGPAGHVAWVSKVSGTTVTVEEYNFEAPEGYGTRTVPKNSFNYIHVKV
jgi:surface antigen